jgi:hypothetical protein
MTPTQQALLDEVIATVKVIPHYCYATAQQVVLHSPKGMTVRYHEGIFGRLHSHGCGGHAHAWNTVNGKIIDLTMKGKEPVLIPKNCYYLYKSKFSLSKKEWLEAFLDRQVYDWFGNPLEYGEVWHD